MHRWQHLCAFAALALLLAAHEAAAELRVSLETGALWQGRNDVRIPNVGGDRFALDDIGGNGPFALLRLTAEYDLTERHGLRLVFAPLRIRESGSLEQAVEFAGETFGPGSVRTVYQFNAHRFTYRYRFLSGERWDLRAGFTALVRDAVVELRQDGLRGRDTDVGFVPLLHVAGAYRISEDWSIGFDVDALAASQGRAVDLGLRVEYALDDRWTLLAGYRTLEGGADNDEVFSFAWFNSAVIGTRYRF
jgi:hypothetical protein